MTLPVDKTRKQGVTTYCACNHGRNAHGRHGKACKGVLFSDLGGMGQVLIACTCQKFIQRKGVPA